MFRIEHLDRRELVAGEIRAVMARRRVTAAALSASVGIPPATLSRKLSGKSGITVDELLDISEALGTHPNVFLALVAVEDGAA